MGLVCQNISFSRLLPIFEYVDFQIVEGDIFHLKGVNGAGKTTLLKVLSGLIPPDSGDVFFNGTLIQDIDLKQASSIFYLGTSTYLKPYLSVLDNLKFLFFLKNIPFELSVIVNILEFWAIDDYMDVLCSDLSSGQQRKVLYCLLHRLCFQYSKIWILDEPLTYLDALSIEKLTLLIHDFAAQGGMVLFASHHSLSIDTKIFEL